MSAGETDNVKTVFGRCLMQCPSVDLWFMYLKFIKKVRQYSRTWGWGSTAEHGSTAWSSVRGVHMAGG
jgi:hypothetical protein